jgi:hypothetical protein
MGSIPPRSFVAQRRNHFGESKTRNNGSALALRINAGQLFSGREPWFACKPENSMGADEVIQQGKVPEGVTSSYFKRDESQHIPKRIDWKSKSFHGSGAIHEILAGWR